MRQATRALFLSVGAVLALGCEEEHSPRLLEVDAGVPPLSTLSFDPCAARNPVRVLDVVERHDREGIRSYSFELPVGAPVCVRLSNPAPALDCRRKLTKDHRGGSGHGDDEDAGTGAGGGTAGGGSGATGGSGPSGGGTGAAGGGSTSGGGSGSTGGGSTTGGAGSSGGGSGTTPPENCTPTRPFTAEVALDRTALTQRRQRFEPSGPEATSALELSAGHHTLRLRIEGRESSELAIRIEVPGPVVDSLTPLTAEPGTRLSFMGEGYYGPLIVTSADAPLDNATALSFATGFADTTPQTTSGP